MQLDQLLMPAEWTQIKAMCRRHIAGIRVLRNRMDSDDVMQDVWLRLLDSYNHVKPNSRSAAFGLVGLTIRRAVIDLYRENFGSRGQHKAAINGTVPTHALPVEPQAPLSPDVLTQVAVAEAIEHLPPEAQKTVDLLIYCGMTQAQAGELLGCSERQVRRYWEEAREQLARTLGQGK